MELVPGSISVSETQCSADSNTVLKSFSRKNGSHKHGKSVIADSDFELLAAYRDIFQSDAREQILEDNSIDLILTSPPYWQKRNYEVNGQIGQEKTVEEYIKVIADVMDSWHKILKKSGSVFLNIGDSFSKGARLRIPDKIANEIERRGWRVIDTLTWNKTNSTPYSGKSHFPPRREYILQVVKHKQYYFDLQAYKEKFGEISDTWTIPPAQHRGGHLAPFPEELVERILTVACPKYVCSICEKPFKRVTENTAELNENRPQARRALAIAQEKGLTSSHIAAIQAVGISDAGKAIHFQSGAGQNRKEVIELAREAKKILGGYFREFTFAKKRTIGWQGCECKATVKPGLVYDPFIGSGTTFRVGQRLNLSIIGSDLKIYDECRQTLEKPIIAETLP